MKCPWKLNVPSEYRTDDECDPECAWLIESKSGTCACAIAFLASKEAFAYAVKNLIERGA